MSKYNQALIEHLIRYKQDRLGIREDGKYKDKPYGHILPQALRYLNILEPIRHEFQQYLREHPQVKLHQFFHHLNSSQAFAFNLFYPFFSEGGESARILSLYMGVDVYVSDWSFEMIPDAMEGTNVDVAWTGTDGSTTFCEVKLSESEFGSTKNDQKHREKLETIYRPRLTGMVEPEFLEEDIFFRHYQLLRNIALLYSNPQDNLILLLPKANKALHPQLETVLAGTLPDTRKRIQVAYWEDCIAKLAMSTVLSNPLAGYVSSFKEKYYIP